jgi:hypothetical protein|tara:strand:+ start:4186 stop:4458 length:273 start_codon:yes stop_codon:yes gene_type:complete
MFFRWLRRKPKSHQALSWVTQYYHRNPQEDGTDLIHYSKSDLGFFEIYDDGKSYLLSHPRPLRVPAEIFMCLASAKHSASKTLEEGLTHD